MVRARGAVTLGRRRRQAREARGHTQVRVAAEAGVSAAFISGVEAGHYRPRPATLRELAGALGVSYTKLVALVGYAGRPDVQVEAAADGQWFAGLSPERREWVTGHTGRH
jgi:transcriptional regulator with XRE-family HTH domain